MLRLVLCALAIAITLGAASGRGRAHAPLPRHVVLSPDASAIALVVPGFGLLLRTRPERPFAYACDALGVKPSGQVPALVYVDDGSLLLGSADGMRILGRTAARATSSRASSPARRSRHWRYGPARTRPCMRWRPAARRACGRAAIVATTGR